jgi:hypothetical protein
MVVRAREGHNYADHGRHRAAGHAGPRQRDAQTAVGARRRNPALKLMSVLRGDKYMGTAYPLAWRGPATGADGRGGAAASPPGTTWRGTPAAPQTKER